MRKTCKPKKIKNPIMRLVVIYTLEMSPNRDVEDHLPPKLVDLSSPNSHET